MEIIGDSLHMTHNFELVSWAGGPGSELLVAGREGVFHFIQSPSGWDSRQLVGATEGKSEFAGAGEVRSGRLPGGKIFLATIEPMHGHQVIAYTPPANTAQKALWQRHLLDDSLKEGHALACGDLLGAGFDQVVAGWRGKDNHGKVGIKLFIPRNQEGSAWQQAIIEDNGIACEDLCLADMNEDGQLDIVAAGRATRNVMVLFNERDQKH